jgi:hypothetical protein
MTLLLAVLLSATSYYTTENRISTLPSHARPLDCLPTCRSNMPKHAAAIESSGLNRCARAWVTKLGERSQMMRVSHTATTTARAALLWGPQTTPSAPRLMMLSPWALQRASRWNGHGVGAVALGRPRLFIRISSDSMIQNHFAFSLSIPSANPHLIDSKTCAP